MTSALRSDIECHDGLVRYATAVRRCRAIAEQCQRVNGLWADEPMLHAAYAFGELLEYPDELPVVQVVFVLNLPADELTWGTQPQSCTGLPSLLDIDKAPVDWYLRPTAWPVTNHIIRRPLRIWSLDGIDTTALDALDDGDAESLRLPAPDPDQERRQLVTELDAAQAHLRQVENDYWEWDWQREHRGLGIYPENHLWNAVHGYLDLLAVTQTHS
jgi:hypothetical protein